jgi:hypothetical protein
MGKNVQHIVQFRVRFVLNGINPSKPYLVRSNAFKILVFQHLFMTDIPVSNCCRIKVGEKVSLNSIAAINIVEKQTILKKQIRNFEVRMRERDNTSEDSLNAGIPQISSPSVFPPTPCQQVEPTTYTNPFELISESLQQLI